MAKRLNPLAEILPTSCFLNGACFLSSKHQDYLATIAENISAMRV